MKAAIHVTNLRALERLHQMFSLKQLWHRMKKILCGLNRTTYKGSSASLCELPQISMALKTKPSVTTRQSHTATSILDKTSHDNRKSVEVAVLD